jgi:hypothetical protein
MAPEIPTIFFRRYIMSQSPSYISRLFFACILISITSFSRSPISSHAESGWRWQQLTQETGGYWHLVETIVDPLPEEYGRKEDIRQGELCSLETNSLSEGQYGHTKEWFQGESFFPCELNKNSNFSAVATWDRPPERLFPDVELPLEAGVTVTANDPGHWGSSLTLGVTTDVPRPRCGALSGRGEYVCRMTVSSARPETEEQCDAPLTVAAGSSAGEQFALRYCIGTSGYRYVYDWVESAESVSPEPEETQPEEEGTGAIEGTVTVPNPDYFQNWLPTDAPPTLPLPDVRVWLLRGDTTLEQTFTGGDGRFAFNEVPFAEDLVVSVVLQHAIHAPGDPPYFQIVYNQQSEPITLSTEPFALNEETADPLVKDIRLDEPDELIGSPFDLQPDQYANAGLVYYYTREGWHIAALLLGQSLDLQPLNVRIYSSLPQLPGAGAYWHGPIERKDGRWSNIAPVIELDPAYSNFSWHNRRDVVLHEFGHHLMADSYDNFMPRAVNDTAHAGFTNPSTTDSWTEGFATFFAAWAKRDGLRSPDASIWRDGAAAYNLEVNHLAWSESFGEEFAVASLLWDLLDPIDPTDCTYLPVTGYASQPVITATAQTAYCDYVQIDSNELWPILSGTGPFSMRSSSPAAPAGYPYIFDMVDLYEALQAHYFFYAGDNDLPLQTANSLDPIDELFIAHGFFADVNLQNLTYDLGEEIGTTSGLTLTIGADSFPARSPRRSPPPTPNSYIGYELYDAAAGAAMPPGVSDYFLVEVLFDAPHENYNYSYEIYSGEPGRLLYIGPPAHYLARTRITSLAPDFIPIGELEFTNEFYWQRMAEQPADTFVEYTFVFESAREYGIDQTPTRLLLVIIGLMSMCGCLLLLIGVAAVIFLRSRRK